MDGLSDDDLRAVFARTRTIALTRFSPNPERASFRIAHFLAGRGFRVIGVNPGHAGLNLWGEPVVAQLADIEGPVDMVDVFRRTEMVRPVYEDAVAHLDGLQTVWLQLGIEGAEIADNARLRGLTLVENRCPAIEIPRLFAAEWRA